MRHHDRTNLHRGIYHGPGGGEDWIQIHVDGTLTAANTTAGLIHYGDQVRIHGETATQCEPSTHYTHRPWTGPDGPTS